MEWEITPDEERASFEVVSVDALPPIDREDIVIEPHESRPCGCDWCEGDWPRIADVAVAALEQDVDPFDRKELLRRGRTAGLSEEDLGWLLSLFVPSIAIIVLRDCGQFTNGMHRTHALRMYGVKRCVVYTGKGERPFETSADDGD